MPVAQLLEAWGMLNLGDILILRKVSLSPWELVASPFGDVGLSVSAALLAGNPEGSTRSGHEHVHSAFPKSENSLEKKKFAIHS